MPSRSVFRAALAAAAGEGATRLEHAHCPRHPASVLLGRNLVCGRCLAEQATGTGYGVAS